VETGGGKNLFAINGSRRQRWHYGGGKNRLTNASGLFPIPPFVVGFDWNAV